MTVSQALKHFLPHVHEAIEICQEPKAPDPYEAADWLMFAICFASGFILALILLS